MREAGFEAFDNIAGGETAGIPFAALVAERLALPMTYVRKKPKGYGRNARIEGAMTRRPARPSGRGPDHRRRLEALLRRCDPRDGGDLRPYGGDLLLRHLPGHRGASLAAHGVTLHHLCTWWDVLAEARAQGAFDAATLTEVEAFLNAPRAWQDARATRLTVRRAISVRLVRGPVCRRVATCSRPATPPTSRCGSGHSSRRSIIRQRFPAGYPQAYHCSRLARAGCTVARRRQAGGRQ